jgi:hypothetical protein
MNALWRPQYYQKVLALNPIAYWMLGEKSGAVAYEEVSGRAAGAQNGAHTGVTLWANGIGDGRLAIYYDGANDFTNSAAFAAAFNGAAGTILIWARVPSAGVWTDGADRRVITIQATGNNLIFIRRPAGSNNTLAWRYRAGGVSKSVALGGLSTIDWMLLGLTWDAAADQVKAYHNGAQTGATQNGLGAWAGAPAATTTTIGASSTVPAAVWDGDIQHGVVLDRVLTAEEITPLWSVE